MLGYCPLASGSRGNCIYVGTLHTKLLIDAGISARTIKERLALLDVSLEEIDAIIISHEHSDHIQGLKGIALKYRIPILANTETAKGIVAYLGMCPKFKIFSTGETFNVGDVHIHPFTIQHDTLDPVAFTLRWDGLKLGICTDLGFATTLVQHHLQCCDYLYVESNHEPSMVHSSARPDFLKQRILGRSGHLSNLACAELVCRVAHSGLKHIHLAHLSAECNVPAKALETVTCALQQAGFTLPIDVAPQECIGHALIF